MFCNILSHRFLCKGTSQFFCEFEGVGIPLIVRFDTNVLFHPYLPNGSPHCLMPRLNFRGATAAKDGDSRRLLRGGRRRIAQIYERCSTRQ